MSALHRFAPLILAVALFMEQMDSTIISTSLPVIANDIGVGPITLKLALTAYLVAIGVFIPLSGWMADRFGAKRIFTLAIGVFMLGSLACAAADSLAGFVIARFLQGMGGALMTPVGRAIVLKSANRSELVSAMTLFTLPAVVGPLVGPPLGGFIATYFSWQWIFLVNLPIGILGIVMTAIYIPNVESPRPPDLDIAGFLLSGLAAAGIVFGLSVVSLPALPPLWGAGSVAIGVLAAILFVRHARRHPAPALNLALFRIETFRACITAGSIFRVAFGAVPFLTPLMLQLAFGLSAFHSGMITFTGAIGAILTKFAARWVFAHFGFRRTLVTACAFAAFGTITYSLFTPQTAYAAIVAVMIMSGFSRAFFFTGVNILGYADIETNAMSGATAVNGVFQQISAALGIALAGLILEVSPLLTGTTLSLADFHLTFVIVGLIAALAMIPILKLAGSAGSEVSGHKSGKKSDRVFADG